MPLGLAGISSHLARVLSPTREHQGSTSMASQPRQRHQLLNEPEPTPSHQTFEPRKHRCLVAWYYLHLQNNNTSCEPATAASSHGRNITRSASTSRRKLPVAYTCVVRPATPQAIFAHASSFASSTTPPTAIMSTSYTYESQNNDSLASLSNKISALRGVTVDIYDQARDHTLLDNANERFSSMNEGVKGSFTRLGRMAQAGNRVAILKLSGMIIGVVAVLWYLLGWLFSGSNTPTDAPKI